MFGRQQAYVLVADWLGEPAEIDRDAALAELARRYLRGHAPADDRDLARWAGLPLRDARRGLERIAPELDRGEDGLLRPRGGRARGEVPQPLLLGAYDPVLLGWASREAIVGPHRTLVTDNGLFRPFALVEGRAVGRWRWAKGSVDLEPFEDLSAEVRAALDAEAADVARFLG
jgi:hypothetical protein